MGTGTLWLVGMMGAGKSVVGPLLADRLGLRFVDTDAEIERRVGRSIAAQFEGEGEAAFRARERELVGELAGTPSVVALGGGAVAQPGLSERCRESGRRVWLRARPETLLARLGDAESRPLLAGLAQPERLERLRKLLSEREPHYAAAELVVDTDEIRPEELAARIAGRLSEAAS